jgi:sulfur-carrier protein
MAEQLKHINIEYFAALKEQCGLSSETYTTSASNAKQLYEELAVKHDFGLKAQSLKIAVNDEFVPWDTELKDKDRVVFLAPFAGG